MRAHEFITERKRKKRKSRWAAYGPGPYGGYGYATGYSGDGGIGGDAAGGEGWKDTLAGAALATGLAFGSAGDAEAAKKPIEKPVAQKIVKADPLKQVSKRDLAKSVTGNPHEVVLKNAAQKAGIQGQELAAFLAQCAHETMDFKHMKEIGGKLDFKKYDPRFAPRKAKILGNDKAGDGAKYKGRGYIQLTGKYNYKKAGEALGLPLEQKPELLEKPEIAAKAAVWYWKNRVAPKVDNFKDTTGVTKTINPGLKHLDQRKEKHKEFQVAMR
jgi:predicted chitinase